MKFEFVEKIAKISSLLAAVLYVSVFCYYVWFADRERAVTVGEMLLVLTLNTGFLFAAYPLFLKNLFQVEFKGSATGRVKCGACRHF